jgi:hypothetical protein
VFPRGSKLKAVIEDLAEVVTRNVVGKRDRENGVQVVVEQAKRNPD